LYESVRDPISARSVSSLVISGSAVRNTNGLEVVNPLEIVLLVSGVIVIVWTALGDTTWACLRPFDGLFLARSKAFHKLAIYGEVAQDGA
jgi:hypothetical protein